MSDLMDVKRMGTKRLALLKAAGFRDQDSVRHDPVGYFAAVKAVSKDFVVQHHDPEKILFEIFEMDNLSPQATFDATVNKLPAKLWCAPQSIFSIASLSARPPLYNIGVDPDKMEEAQGALLKNGVYRIRHLERMGLEERMGVLGPYYKKRH